MRAVLRISICIPAVCLLTGCLAPVMMAPAMLPAMMPSLGLMTATTAATSAGNAALQQGGGSTISGFNLPSLSPKPAGVRQTATPRQYQVALSRARAAAAALKKSGAAKMPDYLAVETVSAPRNPPDTVQVMVYDTANRSIASDEIYHFRRAPKLGSKQTIGPFRAQYCGTGTGA